MQNALAVRLERAGSELSLHLDRAVPELEQILLAQVAEDAYSVGFRAGVEAAAAITAKAIRMIPQETYRGDPAVIAARIVADAIREGPASRVITRDAQGRINGMTAL
jgi:hypothetical protein